MSRILVLLAVAMLPAGAATAQQAPIAQTVLDTHVVAGGATAGRSPHRALRQIAAAEPACGRPAMHSVPAGKGHVFGRHALPSASCEAVVASARVAAPDIARGE